MKKLFTRSISGLLALIMALTLLPVEALAYMAEKQDTVTFVDKEGNTVTADESWEEAFPYGTFAFSDFQATAGEGGGAQKITVYRLGGTSGKVTAHISYQPAVSQMAEGVPAYTYAAGANDIRIEVEDPLPITDY